MIQKFCWILFFASVLTKACQEEVPVETMTINDEQRTSYISQAVTKQVEATFNDAKATIFSAPNKAAEGIQTTIKELYNENKNNLLWHDPITGKGSEETVKYINELRDARAHGIDPDTYFLPQIDSLYQLLYLDNSPQTTNNNIEQLVSLDMLLSSSFCNYTSDLVGGRITNARWHVAPRKEDVGDLLQEGLTNKDISKAVQKAEHPLDMYQKLSEKLALYERSKADGSWVKLPGTVSKKSKGEKVELLIKRLKASGDLTKDATTYDEEVVAAVKRFQKRHQLEASGTVNESTLKRLNVPVDDRIEQIQLNLERMRWLPGDLGDRYVWVNIPEFLIRVVDKKDTVSTIKGVVGALSTKTPILVNKDMINIIFSPTWTLPQSIAREEMQYILMNPAVLVVADVDVWLDGKKVNPMTVDWKNVKLNRVRMRQRPKRTNSMGKAKFQFKNGQSIYLHDTPNQMDFGRSVRAESHGCVRVAEPHTLATKLLAGGKWGAGNIRSAMNSGKETYAKLPQNVKVHIFYLTTWVDEDGQLQFRRDIYGYDKRQKAQL